jgi:hypothetical protein
MTNGENCPGGQSGRNAELTLNNYQAPDLRLRRDVGSHFTPRLGSELKHNKHATCSF